MDLTERASRNLDALAPAGACCLLAISGGPDSVAMFDLLVRGRTVHQRRLVVGHVDHGIAAGSAAVAERVERAAREQGIPYLGIRLELGAACSETAARIARRKALRAMAGSAGAQVIVLAHHADDQAETILMRLLRGSGPAGLAGMAARRGPWVRPLLEIGRAELARHLESRGLTAFLDPANADPRHLRSWLRTEIIPRLEQRLPDLVDRLNSAGKQAAEARQAWNAVPALVPELEHRGVSGGISVAAPPLRGYRSEVRHAVLAALGRRFGVPLGTRRLGAIDRLLERDSGVVRLSAFLEAELSFGRLTFQEVCATDLTAMAVVPECDGVVGAARITANRAAAAPAERTSWSVTLAPGRYVARTWRPGDRIRPLGGRGSRPIGVLFREARIPPRRRQQWPVVESSDDATIVWVPGICRSEARIPEPGTEALHVECAFT